MTVSRTSASDNIFAPVSVARQAEYPGFRRCGVDRRVLHIGRSPRNAGRCARLRDMPTIRDQVANILEGGSGAFMQRKKKGNYPLR